MVIDVEGTDGRERGEDQEFERKSTLFSLAASEVLIVNLWENQVGLYQGANMVLLKTVFEVHLSLFGNKTVDSRNQRTLLLFVIRDHIGTTPLADLQETLSADMQNIWASLSKPSDVGKHQLSDYFDMSFATLSHKIFAAEQFESDVQELRKRFMDKGRDDYVFQRAYHKRIPADGVALYMESIWAQVQMNKDLDLPTQQELLAQFRCDEISAVALSEFNVQVKSQKQPVETGRVVEGLGTMMRTWRSSALERYDRDASRYHPGVYERKRGDLVGVLDSALSPLFLGQLKNLHKTCLTQFEREMHECTRGEDYNFAEISMAAREHCEAAFCAGAREAVPAKDEEAAQWTFDGESTLLREDMSSVADQCRREETKKMIDAIERNFKRQILDPIEAHLRMPTPKMWDEILLVFRTTLGGAEAAYIAKAKNLDCTETENLTALSTLRKNAWLVFRTKVDEQTTDQNFLVKLRMYFEERFRCDERGVPRVWTSHDDIDGTFQRARDETLALVTLYSKISPVDGSLAWALPDVPVDALASSDEDFDFAASLTVFSQAKALDLAAAFRKDAEAFYVEAKRSTVASATRVPRWMYGLVAILGWNEAMFFLFNPVYLVSMLFIAVIRCIMIRLGLVDPVAQAARTTVRAVENRFRGHVVQAVAWHGGPVPALEDSQTVGDEDHGVHRD
ncbi:P-loop containing nucleoside triphosphate hydrolase [Phanerochaete sordida]|uniref:P-loop containing nucleoside triphosphate hydrolase n=1 Tax=Phanerochaete sordida TaxID=48140 RepID=A0A9P3G8E4_9APHY|nr:P-loop containing nucleoside triphosphate hydrolase [Phanerochaete sordida]